MIGSILSVGHQILITDPIFGDITWPQRLALIIVQYALHGQLRALQKDTSDKSFDNYAPILL